MQKPYPPCICTLAYTYFKKFFLKYLIRENKAHPGVGYDCLAEQYLYVELVIYLHIRFYRITLENYMMANFGKIFEECINFRSLWIWQLVGKGSMWAEETAREEKLSNTNDWA